MRVKVLKERMSQGDQKFILHLIPNKNNARECKLVRAISKALVKSRPLIGSGPTIKGKKSEVYFSVPSLPEKEYPSDIMAVERMLPWNTAPEVVKALKAERVLAEDKEFKRSTQTQILAKELGLNKLISKNARAKFTCRCDVSFKNKLKYMRHQALCTVMREAAPVLKLTKKVLEKLHEGNSRKVKKGKGKKSEGKWLQDKAVSKKQSRKKNPPKTRRKASGGK
jgi:hypothetical protein